MRNSLSASRSLAVLFLALGGLLLATPGARAVGVLITSLDFDSPGRVFVPTDGSLGLTWTQASFNDSGWQSGNGPFGYGYAGSLAPTTDLETAMKGISSSAYLRFEFDLSFSNPTQVEALSLFMYYDDGFVAYLNGTEVTSSNAPGSPTNASVATASHTADENVLPEFDLDVFTNLLISGTNVLAIHGLNESSSDADFLMAPVMEVTMDPIPEPRIILLLMGSTMLACRRRGRSKR